MLQIATNPVFLVVHDDLLQRNQRARPARSRLVNFAGYQVLACRVRESSVECLTQKFLHPASLEARNLLFESILGSCRVVVGVLGQMIEAKTLHSRRQMLWRP